MTLNHRIRKYAISQLIFHLSFAYIDIESEISSKFIQPLPWSMSKLYIVIVAMGSRWLFLQTNLSDLSRLWSLRFLTFPRFRAIT